MTEKLGPYELNSIVTGDARELADAIPDESVDLIFTDPPYPKKYLYCYRWLGEFADRVLKRPGGLCITYAGKAWLSTVIKTMEASVPYVWCCCLWQNGKTGIVHGNWRVAENWRPLLVFGFGDMQYSLDGIASTNTNKKYHEWEQELAAPSYYIRKLTTVDSIIVDPFVGGGTFPAVCKMLGRNYLAFEIDADTAQDARQRVQMTQPPLIVPEPQQMAFEVDDD